MEGTVQMTTPDAEIKPKLTLPKTGAVVLKLSSTQLPYPPSRGAMNEENPQSQAGWCSNLSKSKYFINWEKIISPR